VTTSRKLEDIAANLDDMSITLEEIKDEVNDDADDDRKVEIEKLEKIESDMERAASVIEESLTRERPAR
jgi:hypothetical protein